MKKIFLLAIMVLLTSTFASAQMAKFRSLYLYQFARNVSWDDAGQQANIVITVVGDQAVARELSAMTKGKMIGGRSIQVIEAATASGLRKSDIIYLGEAKKNQLHQLLDTQAANRVLIVSGTAGHCLEGAGIAFADDNGKLSYEISKENIEKQNVRIAQKLISMGKTM